MVEMKAEPNCKHLVLTSIGPIFLLSALLKTLLDVLSNELPRQK